MGEAKRKRILLDAAAAEMEQLPGPLHWEMDPVQGFMLCAVLQLGLRHPSLRSDQPAVRNARGFIQAFKDNLPPECVAMRQLISMGEDSRFDQPDNTDAPDRKCRVCGCTNERACPGGCSWVEADLCSACAPAAKSILVP